MALPTFFHLPQGVVVGDHELPGKLSVSYWSAGYPQLTKVEVALALTCIPLELLIWG